MDESFDVVKSLSRPKTPQGRSRAGYLGDYSKMWVASGMKLQRRGSGQDIEPGRNFVTMPCAGGSRTSPCSRESPKGLRKFASSGKKKKQAEIAARPAERFSGGTKQYQESIMYFSVKGIRGDRNMQRGKRVWCKTQDQGDSAEEGKSEAEARKAPRVLVVEDNAFNIVPITATLGKNAVDFDIAKNGLMAVERYERTMRDGYNENPIKPRIGCGTVWCLWTWKCLSWMATRPPKKSARSRSDLATRTPSSVV